MDKTTLYLPEGLAASLKDAAKRTGRSQADIIRDALEGYLAGQPRPQPRSVAKGKDAELSARDSEAWLEQNWQKR